MPNNRLPMGKERRGASYSVDTLRTATLAQTVGALGTIRAISSRSPILGVMTPGVSTSADAWTMRGGGLVTFHAPLELLDFQSQRAPDATYVENSSQHHRLMASWQY